MADDSIAETQRVLDEMAQEQREHFARRTEQNRRRQERRVDSPEAFARELGRAQSKWTEVPGGWLR